VTREADVLTSLLARREGVAQRLATVDWEGLVRLAAQQGVSRVVYGRLCQFGLVPPVPGEQLRDACRANAARNLLLFSELGKLLRAAQTARVPVIPLKGAFLAEAVYGNIALRPMADLDLLVKPSDLPTAIEVLRTLGYESDQPFDPASQQARFQDMPPMRKPGGAMVELHWTLVTPLCGARIGQGELEGIWGRSVPATVAGVPSLTLAPEDLLLHLCMHASVHHRFADVGLKAFVDMAEVARHYEGALDWSGFAERANRWSVANGVRMALTLAQEWTDLRVPADVWAQLDGAAPDERTLDWARHKVLEGRPAELANEFARLESEGGTAGKLAALRTAAFRPREVMTRLYGVPSDSWRVLAWYPYHLWDLWSRYRGALWKLLRRDRMFVDDTRREARLREYLGWP
jgi:hypothetical protein